uniref:uncharacterized protein LOC122595859 n=1 Tax=Erigeron canadensis TaxID=72917 RepID=UPI001CB8D9CB|nr:uncharacterized protein LOC122595859 [Erigeron canadensis]
MNNKGNMYAMVMFLFVITTTTISSISCSSSSDINNDEEIVMVVEEQKSYLQPGMMVEKPVQLGRFDLKDGRSVTLLRHVNGKQNCVGLNGDPCGLFDPCCEGLSCDGIFSGTCSRISSCAPVGSTQCSVIFSGAPECCYPYKCTSTGHYTAICK